MTRASARRSGREELVDVAEGHKKSTALHDCDGCGLTWIDDDRVVIGEDSESQLLFVQLKKSQKDTGLKWSYIEGQAATDGALTLYTFYDQRALSLKKRADFGAADYYQVAMEQLRNAMLSHAHDHDKSFISHQLNAQIKTEHATDMDTLPDARAASNGKRKRDADPDVPVESNELPTEPSSKRKRTNNNAGRRKKPATSTRKRARKGAANTASRMNSAPPMEQVQMTPNPVQSTQNATTKASVDASSKKRGREEEEEHRSLADIYPVSKRPKKSHNPTRGPVTFKSHPLAILNDFNTGQKKGYTENDITRVKDAFVEFFNRPQLPRPSKAKLVEWRRAAARRNKNVEDLVDFQKWFSYYRGANKADLKECRRNWNGIGKPGPFECFYLTHKPSTRI